MKTKLLAVCLPVLFFFFCVPAFGHDRIVDNAGLLSVKEKEELQYMTDYIASTYNFDLVIVTEKNIGSTRPMDYADDFFDYNGYGLGEDRDGCLFLQVTESRDYWFSTSGRGIGILNSYAFNKLETGTVVHLKNNDPAAAYRAFILDWEEFLVLDAKGRHYNFFYQWNIILVSVAWLLALAIGFIIVQTWKSGMNTALLQTQAAAYMVAGSLVFTEKKDRFLYSTVSKSQRQTENSSGGGIHTGSSGRSHGGGGGKY